MSTTASHTPKVSFVFFGTDEFSVIILDELKTAGFLPSALVTPPDRPKGRGLTLTPSPAKVWALAQGITVLQPEKLDTACNTALADTQPDCFVVASYGLIIPESTLDIPKKGALNVHPSLLPRYRGATPIESQILGDEKEVGVTIMLMDAKMDHGPIVAQEKAHLESILPAPRLQDMLAHIGGKILSTVILPWIEGTQTAVPQDHMKATYTRKLTKTDGEINLSGDGYANFLKIQAFTGSIGTYFFIEQHGKRIRVIVKSATYADGKLTITRVLPEGKKEMDYEEFTRGLK